MRQIVLAGKTGLVVDGTNIEAVAAAAIELLSDIDRARAMGAAGREWIVSEWSWDLWAGAFSKVLKI